MAKVSESRLWKWLFSGTKINMKRDLHMCRVENITMSGMPDVEGCYVGTQFWIELKTCARPKKADTLIPIRFENGQIPWLERRRDSQGRSWVLIQVGSGHNAARYLIHGLDAGGLVGGVTEEELQGISVNPGNASAKEIVMFAAE